MNAEPVTVRAPRPAPVTGFQLVLTVLPATDARGDGTVKESGCSPELFGHGEQRTRVPVGEADDYLSRARVLH